MTRSALKGKLGPVGNWRRRGWKEALKGVLLIALGAYLVGPLYVYGFTPTGLAVLQFVHEAQQSGTLPEPPLALSMPSLPAFLAKSENSVPGPTAVPAKEAPMSVLLLGYGGSGQEGPYLTDSIVLAIANPKAKTLSLLSIPRDTYLKLPLDGDGGYWSKINTAYAYGVDDSLNKQRPERYKGDDGGGNLAKDAVSTVVGFPVRYYLALDFRAFRQLVDEVGGLDVDVQASFYSLYPDEADPLEDRDYKVIHFDAGKQHFNGARALEYSRARQAIDNLAEGTDFARSRRQRQIMQAFRDKVTSPGGLIHLPGLLGIAMQRLTTDLEVPGLGDLQQLLTDWHGVKITEVALTSENYLTSELSTGAAYILSPVPAMAD
ncbi:MAG: LCP family protein, partial [Dehalococcoidia bacterium]|nr:LCP family protein [Dehalococcoidia bacterium]